MKRSFLNFDKIFICFFIAAFILQCGPDKEKDKDPPDSIDSEKKDTATEDEDSEEEKDASTDEDTESSCVHPEVIKSCDRGLCKIKSGCYIFGSPETETCRHTRAESQAEVVLTNDFWIGETEVTQKEWEELGFPNPSAEPLCAECPVGYINWYETLAFCNALSEKEGLKKCYNLMCCEGTVGRGCPEGEPGCIEGTFRCSCDVQVYENYYECPGYRLPTKAEWQYAARAGTTTATYIGNLDGTELCYPDSIAERIAWYCGNATGPKAVKQKEPNKWGLYDTAGNMWEWTHDYYDSLSIGDGSQQVVDPVGPSKTQARTMCGGSFMHGTCKIRSAAHGGVPPEGAGLINSFRIARTVIQDKK